MRIRSTVVQAHRRAPDEQHTTAPLLACVREGGDDSQPNIVVAQRDAASPREIFRSMRATSLLGARVDERNNRRGVSFATFDSEGVPRTATWYARGASCDRRAQLPSNGGRQPRTLAALLLGEHVAARG